MTTHAIITRMTKVAAAACLALAAAAPAGAQQSSAAGATEKTAAAGDRSVTTAFDFVDVNGDRPAKFYQGQSVPAGFVLPSIHWDTASADLSKYVQVGARNLRQSDEQVGARFAAGTIRGRFDWARVPWVSGNGARSLLSNPGGPVQSVSPNVQRLLQDPNADGILGSADDNAMLPSLVRNLLGAATPFSIESARRTGEFGLSFAPAESWGVDVSYRDERRAGGRAMGTGTYDRITSVPPSGVGGDESFILRGTELVRPIDFTSRTFRAGTSVTRPHAFGSVAVEWSRFENGTPSLTYGNPLWFTDSYAASAATCPPGIERGQCRGLWSTGRLALEPSNEGVSFDASGGFNLARATRLTVTMVKGRVTQNEPFLPYTANTALNGRVDLNGDGVVDSRDSGTTTATLPRQSLDGKADSTSLTVGFTTRPSKIVQINVRVPYFDYKQHPGELSFPYRAEYIESNWNGGIQSIRPVRTENASHSTRAVFVEGIVRPVDTLSLRAFAETRTHDYEEREIASNHTRTFGFGVAVAPAAGIDARATYARADRSFDGRYAPKYTGEQLALRMFDIANLTRDALTVDVSADVKDRVTLGANARYTKDDYPDSAFGLQATHTRGFGVDAQVRPTDRVSLFGYYDYEKYTFDGHGDTKFGTFNRPGNDWFYGTADRTQSIGVGLDAQVVPDKYTLRVDLYRVDGNIASSNRNSGAPYSPIAGGAVNFPDQQSTLNGGKLTVTRVLTSRYSVGVSYWLEDYTLADFGWDGLKPYGYDVLTTDNALRYLFLDSRYGSYRVNVGQVFVRVTF